MRRFARFAIVSLVILLLVPVGLVSYARWLARLRLVGPVEVAGGAVGVVGWIDSTLESEWGDAIPMRSGTLSVPEDRSRPGGRIVQLALGVIDGPEVADGPPVYYLPGGPGVSGFAVARSEYLYLFRELARHRQVVLHDLRGTGASLPNLACTGEMTLPTDVVTEVEGALTKALIRDVGKCLDLLRREGIAVEAYHTEQIADDLEDLRRALGHDRIVLYGTSYGTELAIAYLHRYPDRVAGMILQGPVSPDLALKSPAAVESQFDGMGRLLAADPRLSLVVPDLRALMRSVHASAREEPWEIHVPLMDAVDEGDPAPLRGIFRAVSWFKPTWDMTLTDAHLQLMAQDWIGRDDWIPRLPAYYYRMASGDRREIGNRLRNFRRRPPPHPLLITVNCRTSYTDGRLREIAAEEQPTVFTAFGIGLGRRRETCRELGLEPLGPAFLEPFDSDVPVLFVAGDLDGRTPLSNVEALSRRFPNHATHLVRGGAHNGLLDNATRDAMLAFLDGRLEDTEVTRAIRFESPAGYARDLAQELHDEIASRGVESTVATYRRLAAEDATAADIRYDFREATLNNLGYRLLAEGRVDAAIAIFELNAERYPDDANVWDSLGEALLAAGDREAARRAYERAIAIDFTSGNARKMLREVATEAP